MKILFVGPVVENEDIITSAAVSPAANKWQLDLIGGLKKNGVEVYILSYLPEPSWPKGRLFVKNTPFINPITSIKYIRYLNFPVLRFYFLKNKFIKALTSMFQNGEFQPDILITYNSTKQNSSLGLFFQERYKRKWISIIADGYIDGNPNGVIFLSHGYYKKTEKISKLHLDGAPPEFQGLKNLHFGKKIILYSGSLDIWTGIEHFVKQFIEIDQSDFELHIYGKGINKEIERISENSKNVSLMGFVSIDELSEVSTKAYAFVNPRPTHLPEIENNFPSKILQYISFGRPIISTKTEGISPIYDDMLLYYNPLDISTLQAQICHLSNLSEISLTEIYQKNQAFCKNNTWENQAAKIISLGKVLL